MLELNSEELSKSLQMSRRGSEYSKVFFQTAKQKSNKAGIMKFAFLDILKGIQQRARLDKCKHKKTNSASCLKE